MLWCIQVGSNALLIWAGRYFPMPHLVFKAFGGFAVSNHSSLVEPTPLS